MLSEKILRLKEALQNADALLIGAGSGLSTSAGFRYSGERFERHFLDFQKKYGFRDMYSGGFYPYQTLEEFWGFWSRYVWINRYQNPPEPVYQNLFSLVQNKDYFVITTNVDHCFQKAGFDKTRLFYTQGDYGLFQCSEPCHQKTYDNQTEIRAMLKAQGFSLAKDESFSGGAMEIPPALVPHCPVCKKPMAMNLRADNTFVQDQGWDGAAKRYEDFLERTGAAQNGKILFLELGVGANTPGIIKYPFWRMAALNENSIYACLNYGEAVAPKEIEGRSICVNEDIGKTLQSVL